MSMNWSRGFFRAWIVIALSWIGLAGWGAYNNKPWNLDWGTTTLPRTAGECWNRLALWPDGKPFDQWDIVDEVDTPSNVEINRKAQAWAADSIIERNRWVAEVRRRLLECEAREPITKKMALRASRIWISVNDSGSLLLMLAPPLVLLFAGVIISWVVQGFRPTST